MTKKNENNDWKRKRRQNHLEMKKDRYYIFCEGERTEPNYFNGFKKLIENNPVYRDMILIEIQPCVANTIIVLNMAEKYVEKNEIRNAQIWCIYDKDDFPPERFNEVTTRVSELNQKNKELQYHAAWSNECIEFWFLLHFTYYTVNNHREEYKKSLDKEFKRLSLGEYHKNMDNIFEILMEKGNPKLAIKYAKKIINEGHGKTPTEIAPGTKVYELVEELAKYFSEEFKDKFL